MVVAIAYALDLTQHGLLLFLLWKSLPLCIPPWNSSLNTKKVDVALLEMFFILKAHFIATMNTTSTKVSKMKMENMRNLKFSSLIEDSIAKRIGRISPDFSTFHNLRV